MKSLTTNTQDTTILHVGEQYETNPYNLKMLLLAIYKQAGVDKIKEQGHNSIVAKQAELTARQWYSDGCPTLEESYHHILLEEIEIKSSNRYVPVDTIGYDNALNILSFLTN